jgi:hypothetical protein
VSSAIEELDALETEARNLRRNAAGGVMDGGLSNGMDQAELSQTLIKNGAQLMWLDSEISSARSSVEYGREALAASRRELADFRRRYGGLSEPGR